MLQVSSYDSTDIVDGKIENQYRLVLAFWQEILE